MIMHTALYKELANKLPVTIPSQNGSLTYTGGVQSPGWNGFYDNLMDISGQTSGTNAGNYTVTFSLKDKKQYQWENGTVTDKTVTWTIDRAIGYNVPVIDVNNYPTYNGSEQSILPYVSYSPVEYEIVGGDSSGIDAGTYFLDMQSTSNYLFPIYNNQTGEITNATSDAFSVGWRIEKANPNLTVNPTSITLDSSNTTKTITVSRSGDGAITATSSNTNIATVSVSGNIVTVNKGNSSGSTTITISVASSTNYEAGNTTVSVAVGKTVYVWDVYDVTSDYVENTEYTQSEKFSNVNLSSKYFGAMATNYTITSTGYYQLSSPTWCNFAKQDASTKKYLIARAADTIPSTATSKTMYYNVYQGNYAEPLVWLLETLSETTGYATYNIHLVRDSQKNNSSPTYITFAKKTVVNGTPSQGDTKTGTVTSSNRNAYPDNGASGSNWYVYVGTDVSFD